MPMAAKLGTVEIKSKVSVSGGIVRSRKKLDLLYLYYHKVYYYQT